MLFDLDLFLLEVLFIYTVKMSRKGIFNLSAPYIILKLEEEEKIAPNLRASFKERQLKCLFESLPTALPPAKRTCPEDPHKVRSQMLL